MTGLRQGTKLAHRMMGIVLALSLWRLLIFLLTQRAGGRVGIPILTFNYAVAMLNLMQAAATPKLLVVLFLIVET